MRIINITINLKKLSSNTCTSTNNHRKPKAPEQTISLRVLLLQIEHLIAPMRHSLLAYAFMHYHKRQKTKTSQAVLQLQRNRQTEIQLYAHSTLTNPIFTSEINVITDIILFLFLVFE